VPLVLLAGLSCCAYLNADHEEFLFDSAGGAIENRYSRDLWGAARRLFRHPLRPGSQVANFTFAVNYAANKALGQPGFDVTGFLVVNVLIHAANACLVYFLILALLRRVASARPPPVWTALAPAALFAVHPIHASSVAYIIQRRGLLATAFYISAILAYLAARGFDHTGWQGRSVSSSSASRRGPGPWPLRRIALAAAVPLCYWLSFRSKPLGLPLPLAILMIEFCLRARDRRALRRYLGWALGGLVVTTAGLLAYLWSRDLFDPVGFRILPWGKHVTWGPWTQFLTESRAFLHYWKLLLLPLGRWSCIDHVFPLSQSLGEHYAGAAVAVHGVLLAVATVGAFRGWLLPAVGVFWFYVALTPYVILPQSEPFVEYKTYLPCVGVCLILAEGLRRIRHRVPAAARGAALVLAVVGLLFATVRRNAVYQSALNLWKDAVQKSPQHWRPLDNLGKALTDLGRYDEAIEAFEASLRLKPNSSKTHNNLGTALEKKGLLAEAVEHYATATRINDKYAEAYNNLGSALAKLGRWPEAAEEFERALEADPYFHRAYNNLGTARAREGRREEALALFLKAVEINPDYAAAHTNLGNAWAERREFDKAITHYRIALRLQPDLPEARKNLDRVLAERDKRAAGF
jgi:Flp pilus assembly protein TadD